MCSLLFVSLVADGIGLDVVRFFLGLVDLDEVGHDLLVFSDGSLVIHHNFNLHTEDSLSELDVSDGNIDEVELGLTGRDHISLLIFLRLCSLTSDLSSDKDFTTLSTTSSHDETENVVSSKSDGGSTQKFEFKGLSLGSSAQVLVVGEGLD
jgi:hypothetical protein